jgi:hypothetical protein
MHKGRLRASCGRELSGMKLIELSADELRPRVKARKRNGLPAKQGTKLRNGGGDRCRNRTGPTRERMRAISSLVSHPLASRYCHRPWVFVSLMPPIFVLADAAHIRGIGRHWLDSSETPTSPSRPRIERLIHDQHSHSRARATDPFCLAFICVVCWCRRVWQSSDPRATLWLEPSRSYPHLGSVLLPVHLQY